MADIVVKLPRCSHCLHTSRRVERTRTQVYAGQTANGLAYNLIVRRWVRCGNCGRLRIERSYELTATA